VAIRTVLLDIEGTATPIDFVYKVLFPYARTHVGPFLVRHRDSGEVRGDIAGLLREHTADAADTAEGIGPPWPADQSQQGFVDSIVAYVHWLMDRDRKSTPLKSLQGKIWEEGYRAGELRSEVFDDVSRGFERWRKDGKQICIYSSGSVLAQNLLFANTEAGDLTAYIDAYFDTNSGGKTDPESYARIATVLQRSPAEILFVSDAVRELDAARAAGVGTLLCLRPGNPPQPESVHRAITSFDNIR
jgi:enolase-phosphatase E1